MKWRQTKNFNSKKNSILDDIHSQINRVTLRHGCVHHLKAFTFDSLSCHELPLKIGHISKCANLLNVVFLCMKMLQNLSLRDAATERIFSRGVERSSTNIHSFSFNRKYVVA